MKARASTKNTVYEPPRPWELLERRHDGQQWENVIGQRLSGATERGSLVTWRCDYIHIVGFVAYAAVEEFRQFDSTRVEAKVMGVVVQMRPTLRDLAYEIRILNEDEDPPFYYASAEVLNRLSETTNPQAVAWRAKCWGAEWARSLEAR